MFESTAKYLRCVICKSALSIEPLTCGDEVQEGFLSCTKCNHRYPVISSVPFLLEDFSSYLAIRMALGGELMLMAKSSKMKLFVKEMLGKIKHVLEDTSELERNWVGIYKRSIHSQFYVHVKNLVHKLPRCDFVLEHGCSIGHLTAHLAKQNSLVFGIDKSFYAILEAKKHQRKNLDFIVADSLNSPFGSRKFDLVVVLNLLDIVEPRELLQAVSHQSKKFLMISDPYDFERGKASVKSKISPDELRLYLRQSGFKLIRKTSQPSFIPWKLNMNSRLSLNYKVDLILGQNTTKDD
ncbi:MAG: class I SAM-dependent methyltransferase [Thaumarchaeota archaeon]|nr:class I SAM-dependent methyltransferase [Nitrososphaerota archaeon]